MKWFDKKTSYKYQDFGFHIFNFFVLFKFDFMNLELKLSLTKDDYCEYCPTGGAFDF